MKPKKVSPAFLKSKYVELRVSHECRCVFRALEDLKTFSSPPALVKFVAEAVVILLNNLGDKPVTWDDCKRAMKGDFIQRILIFDPLSLSQASVSRVKKNYLSNADWNFERINKASQVYSLFLHSPDICFTHDVSLQIVVLTYYFH